MSPDPALGVYIHWPYCARICPYCAFNVRRDRGADKKQSDLAEAIISDLRAHAALTGPRSLVSIYLGGGTPSLMDPDIVARMIGQAKALWTLAQPVEVTLEANPADVDVALMEAFADAGVNRISLGVQSLRDPKLKRLGRNHDSAMAGRAVAIARTIFERVSVDLIYALPGQCMDDWARELGEVVDLGPEHISAYQLTIEPGTSFARAAARGALQPLEADLAADLFEATGRVLGKAGFDAYEVSNHALAPAAQSRHNLVYWRGEDYVGVGPGAHGRITLAGGRWECIAARDVAAYIAAASGDGRARRRPLSVSEAALERLMMGLRTFEGVPLAEIRPLNIQPELEALARAKFIDLDDDRVVARQTGRMVLDRIVLDLAMANERSAP